MEHSITDLRKRMLEQQRAIKMNEKNEAQVKKLAEDIRGIKAQKVRPFIRIFCCELVTVVLPGFTTKLLSQTGEW